MKKYYFIYSVLTILFIGISYKIKDDYFYIPYPNAIEFVLAFVVLLFTFIIALWKTNRKLKIVLGVFSIIILKSVVNFMNYYFEWHPLIHSLPFTKSQSCEVNFEPAEWSIDNPSNVGLNETNINQ